MYGTCGINEGMGDCPGMIRSKTMNMSEGRPIALLAVFLALGSTKAAEKRLEMQSNPSETASPSI